MKKLLIIENDVDTIEIVSIILEEFNNYVVVKSDKQLPVAQIAEINPNVIVIDYLLGSGYGSDLCLALKGNPLTKHLPVILISASANLEKVIRDCQADAFLSKPFDLNEFVELIDRMAT